VSGIVDRLEKQGIVERIRSSNDRRVVRVNVTSEHKALVKNKFEVIEQKFEDVMDKATEDEVKKVFEGLEILIGLLEKTI
jgi:DNA-binding MarR family transcriptional regulator